MATLKELNIKILSLKQTQKITSAMKLIATTRFNKMQSTIRKSSEYLNALNSMYAHIQKNNETNSSPKASVKPVSSEKQLEIRFLLFTSDRGLCGSFNNAIIKTFEKLLHDYSDQTCSADFIGKRGYEYFKNSSLLSETRLLEGLGKHPRYQDLLPYANEYLKSFETRPQMKLIVVYNEFISAISQKPQFRQLLPFVDESTSADASNSEKMVENSNLDSAKSDAVKGESDMFLFEPNSEILAQRYLEEMLRFNLYQILLQSVTGEHAARMTAMDNATRNCDELIDSYTLERNRVRQAAITTELTEIISGAEAAASA